MSASVASPTIGLLSNNSISYSPSLSPVTPDALEENWQDHMEVDRPNNATDSANAVSTTKEENAPQETEVKHESDRNEAIGSLLAALGSSAPHATHENQPQDGATTNAGNVDGMAPNDVEQAIVSNGAPGNEEAAVGGIMHARLPSFSVNDANALFDMPIDNAVLPDIPMPTTPQQGYDLPFPDFDPGLIPMMDDMSPLLAKKQYDAFARLEFADGIFYLNTYQCELGRDQHAYRDALQRDKEAREKAEAEAAEKAEEKAKSSSGKAPSRRSDVIRATESQIQGSVVSEAGGFAGVDERPVEGYGEKRAPQNGVSHSSQASESSAHVRPADLFHNPHLTPFDYNKTVYGNEPVAENNPDEMVDDEKPAPVTADHMPNPESCPLIPIHTTLASSVSEIESLKAISRRHVKIYWSWKHSAFYMNILGRNGAFLNTEWHGSGEHLQLYSGSKIQISAVEFTFRLPVTADESVSDGDNMSYTGDQSMDVVDSVEGQPTQRLKLKLNLDGSGPGTSGEQKRRGPGRPPKNGYMSQREMKEQQKAEKEAKARAANGGKTPPPSLQRKFSKTQLPDIQLPVEEDADKKKLTKKRSREEEEEEAIPSIEEPAEETPVVDMQAPLPKRQKSKSPSPDYKPYAECTPEDLARPPHNYAVLLYMILEEHGQMRLHNIYRAMKMRWPYFKYVVESDGWQSSVRHNLNQECDKLFLRGPKEGKGYKWYAKPGAMEEYQAQKNKRSNAAAAPKPRAPPQKPQYPASHGQQLTWQNQAPAGQQNNFGQPQNWPQQPPNNNGQPPNAQNQQRPNQPPSQSNHPPHNATPAPPPPQPSQACSPFQPVTTNGLKVILQFERGMLQRIPQQEEVITKWRRIFYSAKQRCLHGAQESTVKEFESEEQVIITHIENFIKQYPNPNFRGFQRPTEPPSISDLAASAALAAGALPESINNFPTNTNMNTNTTASATSSAQPPPANPQQTTTQPPSQTATPQPPVISQTPAPGSTPITHAHPPSDNPQAASPPSNISHPPTTALQQPGPSTAPPVTVSDGQNQIGATTLPPQNLAASVSSNSAPAVSMGPSVAPASSTTNSSGAPQPRATSGIAPAMSARPSESSIVSTSQPSAAHSASGSGPAAPASTTSSPAVTSTSSSNHAAAMTSTSQTTMPAAPVASASLVAPTVDGQASSIKIEQGESHETQSQPTEQAQSTDSQASKVED